MTTKYKYQVFKAVKHLLIARMYSDEWKYCNEYFEWINIAFYYTVYKRYKHNVECDVY